VADYISARQARLADYSDRPRPIKAAADKLSKLLGVAGALITALVGWGILTGIQGDAVTGLLGAIPGVVTAVTTVMAAFGVVRRAEPLVTPMSDPRTDNGTPFVTHSPPGDFGSGMLE
jgi:hypothetical protein